MVHIKKRKKEILKKKKKKNRTADLHRDMEKRCEEASQELNLQPLPTISHSPLPSFHSTGWDIPEDRQALIQRFQPHRKCDKNWAQRLARPRDIRGDFQAVLRTNRTRRAQIIFL